MNNEQAASAYEELVAAIVKAVQSAYDPGHYIAHDGKIWLDDVLRAMFKIGYNLTPFSLSALGGPAIVNIEVHSKMCSFYLGHDLAWHRGNATETITFLHSLLCK